MMTRERRGMTLVVVGLLASLLVGAAACASGGDVPGQIELSATEFDFGTVANTEPVSQVFEVRNVGRGVLEITGVSTSCGCTTAAIADHRLAAGEATDLTVVFDPQAHGGETGTFLRLVYVRSSDPDTPEANLALRVAVVEAEAAG